MGEISKESDHQNDAGNFRASASAADDKLLKDALQPPKPQSTADNAVIGPTAFTGTGDAIFHNPNLVETPEHHLFIGAQVSSSSRIQLAETLNIPALQELSAGSTSNSLEITGQISGSQNPTARALEAELLAQDNALLMSAIKGGVISELKLDREPVSNTTDVDHKVSVATPEVSESLKDNNQPIKKTEQDAVSSTPATQTDSVNTPHFSVASPSESSSDITAREIKPIHAPASDLGTNLINQFWPWAGTFESITNSASNLAGKIISRETSAGNDAGVSGSATTSLEANNLLAARQLLNPELMTDAQLQATVRQFFVSDQMSLAIKELVRNGINPLDKADREILLSLINKTDARLESKIPQDVIKALALLTPQEINNLKALLHQAQAGSDAGSGLSQADLKTFLEIVTSKNPTEETHKDTKQKSEPDISQPVDIRTTTFRPEEPKPREQEEQPSQKQNQLEEQTNRKAYTIRQGDTLESIAGQQLKDSRLAPLIYQLNRQAIPSQIVNARLTLHMQPGKVLYLPNAIDIKKSRGSSGSGTNVKFEYTHNLKF